MTRMIALSCVVGFIGIGPASAAAWTMLEELEVSIGYGDIPTNSSLTVTCSAKQSEIFVKAAPGTKPSAEPVVLVVKEGAASNTIKLKAYVCGRPTPCMGLPDGDVPTYEARSKGKAMALRFAEKMTSAELDAPGAKLSVGADKAVFQKFAAACRTWK